MNGTQELKVAVAQFTVRREPEWNLDIIDGYAWQAADAGAFGSPFYVVRESGERFWGQDRLDFLDRHLATL